MTRARDRGAAADVRFFKTPVELRRWFAKHHASEDVLWVGFYKKDSGEPSVTWPESVDEALSVGWIDGIRKRIDDNRYKIRFTRRRPGSIWSAVNIARAGVLIAEGRMTSAGLAAFEARDEARSALYSYEQRQRAALEPEQEARFRANAAAWEWFQGRTPSWRRGARPRSASCSFASSRRWAGSR